MQCVLLLWVWLGIWLSVCILAYSVACMTNEPSQPHFLSPCQEHNMPSSKQCTLCERHSIHCGWPKYSNDVYNYDICIPPTTSTDNWHSRSISFMHILWHKKDNFLHSRTEYKAHQCQYNVNISTVILVSAN